MRCSYCSIVKDYENKPKEYPDMKYYHLNERDSLYWIEVLLRLKKHNKDVFVIFYGGEPLLYNNLYKLIIFCNDENINYTIISNNTDSVQDRISDLFEKVGELKGFTSSVDPLIYEYNRDSDQFKKSYSAMSRLSYHTTNTNDVVAEITVTKDTLKYLEVLIKDLSKAHIYSSVTFVDFKYSKYYDFSNVSIDKKEDISYEEAKEVFNNIIKKQKDGKYLIHMPDVVLPKLLKSLENPLSCEQDFHLNNITIDSDGSIRTCLRIRGIETPKFNFYDYIDENGIIHNSLQDNISEDIHNLCLGCNWTCTEMSKFISQQPDELVKLTH